MRHTPHATGARMERDGPMTHEPSDPLADCPAADDRPPLMYPGLDDDDSPPLQPPSPEAIDAAVRCFQTLGSATRLRMLHRLRERPGTLARDLAEVAGVDPAAASRHLGALVASRLVRRRRWGRRVKCRLTPLGEWAIEQAVELGTVLADLEIEAPPAAPVRDPRVMTWMTFDQAFNEILFAVIVYRTERYEESWARTTVRVAFTDVEPRLPLLFTIVQRLSRGEPLDGLPLPPDVIAHYRPGWEQGCGGADCPVCSP
jgi:DNA-binding transcriptional ArsR family regulator